MEHEVLQILKAEVTDKTFHTLLSALDTASALQLIKIIIFIRHGKQATTKDNKRV